MIIVLLFLTRPETRPDARPAVAVRVQSMVLAATDVQPRVTVTGRLQPASKALLRFEVSGQLDERLVEPGQRVEPGAVLLKLANADARDNLAEASARLEMETAAVKRDRRLLEIAAKDVVLQQHEVKRLEQLGSESLVSASRLDQARQKLLQLESSEAQLRYSVETAAARLKTARASRSRAQRNLDRTVLTAPFPGTVNKVNVEPGDYLTPTTVAAEIVDLDNIDFYAEVSGTAAAALSLQQAVQVNVDGTRHAGTLVALRSDPDPQTFTHAMRVRLLEKGGTPGLLPGALADVELPLQPLASVIAVPVSSLLQEDGRSYVFIIKDRVLQRREVTPGIRDGDRVVIHNGLAVGETIVARDVAALSDGQVVVVGE